MRGPCRECNKPCSTHAERAVLAPILQKVYVRGWEYGGQLTCDACVMHLVHLALRDGPHKKAA